MLDRSGFAEANPDAVAASGSGMLRRPTVSVIVTNYNYERFIGDCLASILAQTVQPDEVIVVDDRSTDGSIAAIEKFIAENEGTGHFEIHQPDENGGQMNAFYEGFQRSSGAFVVFVDADDWLFPDFIETHLAAHLNPEFTAGMTCSNEVIVDGENRILASSIDTISEDAFGFGGAAAPAAETSLAARSAVRVRTVEGWREPGRDMIPSAARRDLPLLYVGPNRNETKEWIWSTTSCLMFRRGVLEICLREAFRDVRICADYLLLHFCHLVGGTILIQTPHGAYRRHGANNFASISTVGRGVRAGQSAEFPSGLMQRRIADEMLANLDEFERLFGKPRMLQTVSGFLPVRRAPEAVRALGPGRWVTKAQMLAFFVLRHLKLKLLWFRWMARFL